MNQRTLDRDRIRKEKPGRLHLQGNGEGMISSGGHKGRESVEKTSQIPKKAYLIYTLNHTAKKLYPFLP